jgi:hypothetical protein
LFVDQNTGWFSNVTLKTTDGGISWFHTNGLSYDYIAFPSAETGYSCGVTGAITKTIDGGFNWKSPEKYKTRYLNSICFINNSKPQRAAIDTYPLMYTSFPLYEEINQKGRAHNALPFYFLNLFIIS